MSFLVLLLAILVEKFSALRQRVQRDGMWLAELTRLESSPKTAAASSDSGADRVAAVLLLARC